MSGLAIFLLGPPRIELEGKPIHIGRRKVLALLAYLALTEQRHSRETLAAFLAPEFDSSDARTDLRRTLSLLNSLLGQGWLAADRETVGMQPDADLWLDVNRFRQCLGACQSHGHPLAEACPRCVPLLEEAAALVQGDFMAGFSLPDSLPFDEWQRFESEAFHQELASALERLVRGLSAQDDPEGAIPHTRRWLELNLTHEPAHRALMELYARTGQTSAALRQYEYCVQTLAEELGVPPSDKTMTLHEQIRDGDFGALRGVTSAPLQHTPEVPHNLPPQPTPFVGREEELAELDELISDPVVRLITVVGPGGIGKTRLALASAERQLTHPPDSQVSESTNRRSHPFPDGVYFAPLARLNSPGQMVSALAEALDFQFESLGSRTPEQQLLGFLHERRMLLVLDNLEHLLEAPLPLSPSRLPRSGAQKVHFAPRDEPPQREGSRSGAELAADILAAAPAIQILATSRERLQLHEEQVYGIQGLDYQADFHPEDGEKTHSLGETADYAAARLFLQSAAKARHDFTPAADDIPALARICQIVDGMPLALELAASWVDTLSLAKIADEVGRGLDVLETEWHDVPQRHRSVRAAFDASWRRLDPAEREVFAQISVFRGGFTREAARAVVSTGTGTPFSYRFLARLVNKSLLHYSQNRDRYAMHELLRQYGEEKLIDQKSEFSVSAATKSDFFSVRERHCAYYCAALERWGKDLHGARQAAALDEIEADLDNARNAWEWAATRKDVTLLDQSMEGYKYFFWRKVTYHDGIAQFQLAIDALGQVDALAPDFADAQRVLARATIHQAHYYSSVGRRTLPETLLRRAEKLLDGPVLIGHDTRRERALLHHRMGRFEQALPLYRSLGDRASEAWCLMELGLREEGLAIHRALENQSGVGPALFHIGAAAHRRGHFVQAKRLLGDILPSFRAGNSTESPYTLAALADVHRDSGDDETARQMYEGSLAPARAHGEWWAEVRAWLGLGALALQNYDAREARGLLKACLTRSQESGDRRYSAPALAALGHVALVLGEFEACLYNARQSLLIHREYGHADAVALDLASQGAAHWLMGAFDAADAAIKEGLAIARERQQGRSAAILSLVECQWMLCVARYAQAAARAGDVLALVRNERVETLLVKDPDISKSLIFYSYLYTPPRYQKTGVIGWAHGVLGWAALAQGQNDNAHQSLKQAIAALREVGDREYEAWALTALGATALAKGERAEAQRHLRAALKTVVEIRAYMPLLHLMPIIPMLWADAKEPALRERAVELCALANSQPFVAKSRLFEDVAGKQIAAAAATLPPEVVTAAEERGRALDWWETAEVLLVELRELGWASSGETGAG